MNIGHWDVFLLAGRYTLLEQTALAELFPSVLSKERVSFVVARSILGF